MGKSLVLLVCAMLVMVSTRVVLGDDEKDKADASWTDWAKEKFNKNFGMDTEKTKEKANELVEDAGNATSKATGSIVNATSDATNYATEKAGEAANATSNEIHKAKDYVEGKPEGRKTMEYGDNAKTTISKGKRVLLRSLSESTAEQGKNAYNEAKETVKSGSDTAKESMEDAYDEAKNKMGEAYDVAKEKASKAAHNMGV